MAHPVMLSLVPTAEFVRRVNGKLYVQVLEAVWGTPFVGPGPEEGGLPIQECPRLRDELTGFLNTRLAFNAKITVKWLTHKMLQVFGDEHEVPHYDVCYLTQTFLISPQTLTNGNIGRYNFGTLVDRLSHEFVERMENALLRESGIVFDKLMQVWIHVTPRRALHALQPKARPLTGGVHVKLPPRLSKKGAVLNIQNKDTQCFRCCVLAWRMGLQHVKHAERWLRYVDNPYPKRRPEGWRPQYKELGLDWSMVPVNRPTTESDILAFEEANDLGVYIYRYFESGTKESGTKESADSGSERDDEDSGSEADAVDKNLDFVQLLRKPEKCRVPERELQLLHFRGHYMLVTEFPRLAGKRHARGVRKGATCYRCMELFDTRYGADKLTRHLERMDCAPTFVVQPSTKRLLPKPEEAVLSFDALAKLMPHPLVVFADFETLTTAAESADGSRRVVVASNDDVVSACYAAVGGEGYSVPPEHLLAYHDGEDPAIWFLWSLMSLAKDYLLRCKSPLPLSMSAADEEAFATAAHCHICEGRFYDGEERVRDHCHLSGRFRGAAHDSCNKKWKLPKTIPVFFHNLMGFDSHPIILAIRRIVARPDRMRRFDELMRELDSDGALRGDDDGDVEMPEEPADYSYVKRFRFEILAKTDERYQVIRFGALEFKDSARFLSAKLSDLVDGLREDTDGTLEQLARKFRLLAERHPQRAQLPHLLRKFKMPFRAMTSRAILDAPPVLEPEDYHDDLRDEPVDPDELRMQRETAAELGFTSFRQMLRCYNECDVLQLADVFQDFRATVRGRSGLEPVHYVGFPRLGWDTMMKLSGASIELVHKDNGGWELLDLIDGNICGGLSCIYSSLATANNEMCPSAGLPFDPEKPLSYILPLDVNALYASIMTMRLPVGDIREWTDWGRGATCLWEAAARLLRRYTDDSPEAYFVLCDLLVPDELHDYLDFAPVAKRAADPQELSPEQRRKAEMFHCKLGAEKLMPYLGRQRRVFRHIRLLQEYVVEMGVQITGVYKVYACRQEPFMRDYILENVETRKRFPKTDPRNGLAKLLNNSLYGMCLQNTADYCNTTIHTDADAFVRAADKPTMRTFHIFDPAEEGFMGIVHRKRGAGMTVRTPRLVGLSVLDLSKVVMYRAWYRGIKRVWPNAQLLMMDTDSIHVRVETRDLHGDFARVNAGLFGDFRLDLSKVDKSCPNKDRLGVMKLEAGDIVQFAGIRAKCYSELHASGKSEGAFKGLPKHVQRRQVLHAQYVAVARDASAGLDPAGQPRAVKCARIQSREHHLEHVHELKKSLAPVNDKVYELEDFRSRPLGHWRNREEGS